MSIRVKDAAWPAGATSPTGAADGAAGRPEAEVNSAPPRRLSDAFDTERVAALRRALAEGRIQFDAAKLAALILHYHRGGE